jgi:hypothetical protein
MIEVFLVGLFTIVFVIYKWGTRFSMRAANDVYPFLRKIDLEAVYGTFHPEAEEAMRNMHPPKEFRRVQWKRFHLAIYYCEMMSHNAGVLQSWVRHERKQNWDSMSHAVRRTVQDLRAACVQCQLSTFVIRMRLRWWLVRSALIPFTTLPSFRILLPVGSGDMISYYEKMKALAELFSLAFGEEFHQKLARTL